MMPAPRQQVGDCIVTWEPLDDGDIYISAQGPSREARLAAQAQVKQQFEQLGYEDVPLHEAKTASTRFASWPDIQSKATRLIKGGKVKIVRNSREIVAGVVEGDHGTYNTEIQRQDPTSQSISMWSCECKWDQFAWQRTRQWKRLEGRVCVMPGTLITLDTGEQIPIEEVERGYKVLTHDGIGVVSETMRNQYVGRIFSIHRAGYSDPLQVTENHEMWGVKTPDKIRNASYNQGDLSRQGFKINDGSFLNELPQWVDSQDLRVHDWLASTWVANTPLGVGDHFAIILGYYLAEGNIAYQNGEPREVQWTFHEDERELHAELIESLSIWSRATVRTYSYPDRSAVSIRITDHDLARNLLRFGGKYAREKRLHGSVLRWPTQNLEALLAAHYRGDGTYNSDGRLVHYTASDELARQLFDILVKCGYIPSWQRTKNNGGPNNRDEICSMNRIAYKKQGATKGNGRRRFEAWYLSKITKIDEFEYEGPVCNLAVEGQESYVANGVVVHNCSHVLATYWQALATPLDEDSGPGAEEPQGPEPGSAEGAPAPPEGVPTPAAPPAQFGQVPGGGTGMVPPAGTPGPQKPGAPNQTAPPPQPTGIPGQAPEPQSLIPQYPQDPSLQPAINPVSVPGQKPQTPLNPIQNPGGTFSRVATEQFRNGDMVQLKQADHGQTVGLGAGDVKEIPANSIGEVLGVDPLGLVNVYYAGPQAEAGRLEPHGITAWHWPNDIIPRSDIKPPGPATRRR